MGDQQRRSDAMTPWEPPLLVQDPSQLSATALEAALDTSLKEGLTETEAASRAGAVGPVVIPLQTQGVPSVCKVRAVRGGQEVEVTEVVPGDIVVLDEGSVAPADLRVLETLGGAACSVRGYLQAGPCSVTTAPLSEVEPSLASNIVLAQCVVEQGALRGLVVRTGTDSLIYRAILSNSAAITGLVTQGHLASNRQAKLIAPSGVYPTHRNALETLGGVSTVMVGLNHVAVCKEVSHLAMGGGVAQLLEEWREAGYKAVRTKLRPMLECCLLATSAVFQEPPDDAAFGFRATYGDPYESSLVRICEEISPGLTEAVRGRMPRSLGGDGRATPRRASRSNSLSGGEALTTKPPLQHVMRVSFSETERFQASVYSDPSNDDGMLHLAAICPGTALLQECTHVLPSGSGRKSKAVINMIPGVGRRSGATGTPTSAMNSAAKKAGMVSMTNDIRDAIAADIAELESTEGVRAFGVVRGYFASPVCDWVEGLPAGGAYAWVGLVAFRVKPRRSHFERYFGNQRDFMSPIEQTGDTTETLGHIAREAERAAGCRVVPILTQPSTSAPSLMTMATASGWLDGRTGRVLTESDMASMTDEELEAAVAWSGERSSREEGMGRDTDRNGTLAICGGRRAADRALRAMQRNGEKVAVVLDNSQDFATCRAPCPWPADLVVRVHDSEADATVKRRHAHKNFMDFMSPDDADVVVQAGGVLSLLHSVVMLKSNGGSRRGCTVS